MVIRSHWAVAILTLLVTSAPALLRAQPEGPSAADSNPAIPRLEGEGKAQPGWTGNAITAQSSLEELVRHALTSNPQLAELRANADVAWARVPQEMALPDPLFSANVFALPIETAAGGQRASISFSQRIPSLKRLAALGRQAAAEASAVQQVLSAAAIQVIADVKVQYYRLYLIDQLFRINRANQALLESLAKVANARVRSGGTGAGDVLLANLERSKLEEEWIELGRQLVSTRASLNRLLNRPPRASLPRPTVKTLVLWEPEWQLETLVNTALQYQPEIRAARLRYEAAQVGVTVARLLDVPDLTFGTYWVFIDDDRPASQVVEVGRDAWSLGLSLNIPIYQEKYTAARAEAAARTYAAAARIDKVNRRYASTLADLLTRARTARRTVTLYADTILPLARQTYRSDLDAYSQPNSRTDFERVIEDYQNLLQAEVRYHRALTDLAVAEARIEQAVAVPLNRVLVPPKEPTQKKDHLDEQAERGKKGEDGKSDE